MARKKSSMVMNASLEVETGGPLDSRDVVDSLTDLTDAASFPYFYEGMAVYVKSEKKTYALVGDDPALIENWQEIGVGDLLEKEYLKEGTIVTTPQYEWDSLAQNIYQSSTIAGTTFLETPSNYDWNLGSLIRVGTNAWRKIDRWVTVESDASISHPSASGVSNTHNTIWSLYDENGNNILGEYKYLGGQDNTYYKVTWNGSRYVDDGQYFAIGLYPFQKEVDPIITDERIFVHNVSGLVKEDYSDEWFSDITEQDIHTAVEDAFAQGAVNINEQYVVGEEVLIGTWKENDVIYDLYRKVIDFGALPNSTTKSVAHGISGLLDCVYVSIRPSYRTTSLIYNDSLGGNSAGGFLRFEADNTNIKCVSDANKSSWSAKVVIEFTRERG